MKNTKKAIYDRKYYWEHVEKKRRMGREYYYKVYKFKELKGGE